MHSERKGNRGEADAEAGRLLEESEGKGDEELVRAVKERGRAIVDSATEKAGALIDEAKAHAAALNEDARDMRGM